MPMTSVVSRALRRAERAPDWFIDGALGTLIVVVGLLTWTDRANDGVTYHDPDLVALLLVLAATVPYYLRRRAPFIVFTVSFVSVGMLMWRGNDEGALPLVLVVGAYTLAAYRPARVVIAGAVVMGAVLVINLVSEVATFGVSDLVSSALAFGAAMLIGWMMQSRRRRIGAFEGEKRETAVRAAVDERLRIAQELHDVVAHSLGAIAVQAGVGMKVIDADLAEARRSFENISRTSRASLAEIRRLLGMLRDADGAPSYTPAPGLGDLPRLVQEVSEVGLPVDMTVEGDIDRVPQGVGLAAYRIVQEALSNTVRHADAKQATVRLDSTSRRLSIEVVDDGRGPCTEQSEGHGLVGMRERVAVYGGSLSAGPAANGGFRVAAQLPYDADPVL